MEKGNLTLDYDVVQKWFGDRGIFQFSLFRNPGEPLAHITHFGNEKKFDLVALALVPETATCFAPSDNTPKQNAARRVYLNKQAQYSLDSFEGKDHDEDGEPDMFTAEGLVADVILDINDKKPDNFARMLVLRHVCEGTVRVQMIRELLEATRPLHVDHIVIFTRKKLLGSVCHEALEKGITLEGLDLPLRSSPLEHERTPPHKLLSENDADFVQRMHGPIRDRIKTSDPIMRWYGIREDRMIEIEEENSATVVMNNYRIVEAG